MNAQRVKSDKYKMLRENGANSWYAKRYVERVMERHKAMTEHIM